MTTYKYSNADYIRKYLGLTQTRKLIQTFPVLSMSDEERERLKILIEQKNIEGIKDLLSEKKGNKNKLNFYQYNKKKNLINKYGNN